MARPAATRLRSQPASAVKITAEPMTLVRPATWSKPNPRNADGRARTPAPPVIQRSPSRRIASIARVTTIDGRPIAPTSAPLRKPMAAPTTTEAAVGGGMPGPPRGRGPGNHCTDGNRGADGDVDFAGQDDQRHPERDDQHRRVGHQDVAQIV